MKNTILIVFLGLTVITGCKKKDDMPPEIAVMGDSTVIISLYETYHDSGVLVTDIKSGFFVDTMTNLKTDSIGEYIYRYIAVDEEGNLNVFTRNIKVIVTLDNMAGNYTVVEEVTKGPNAGKYGPYPIIVAKDNNNNRLLISKFGGWGADAIAYATISEVGTITIPRDTFHEGILEGSGTIRYDAKSFTVNYAYEYSEGTDSSKFVATLSD